MRSGEIRTVREYLGLSRRELSQLLQVSEATVQNWEKGKYPPPPGVATEIARLEAFSGRTVQAVLDAADHPSPCLLVYRQDADMPPPGPARTLGAAWWRAVAARARDTLGPDHITIGYADELDTITGSRDRTLDTAITPSTITSTAKKPSHPA